MLLHFEAQNFPISMFFINWFSSMFWKFSLMNHWSTLNKANTNGMQPHEQRTFVLLDWWEFDHSAFAALFGTCHWKTDPFSWSKFLWCCVQGLDELCLQRMKDITIITKVDDQLPKESISIQDSKTAWPTKLWFHTTRGPSSQRLHGRSHAFVEFIYTHLTPPECPSCLSYYLFQSRKHLS